MKAFHFLLFITLISACSSEPGDPLQEILSGSSSAVTDVVDQKDRYEVQIRYTQIDRDSLNRPSFTSYEFNVDSNRYFYPASTVKMPIAFLAMEFINNLRDSLKDERIDMHSAIRIDSLRDRQSVVIGDTTSRNGQASVAHYIKKIFTVSDNDAYNRLFELMGRDYINDRLADKGYH